MNKKLQQDFGELIYYKPNSLKEAYDELFDHLKANMRGTVLMNQKEPYLICMTTAGMATIHKFNKLLQVYPVYITERKKYGVFVYPREGGIVSDSDDDKKKILEKVEIIFIICEDPEQAARKASALLYWINFLSQ